jgi:xanthine dehydrogenase accessory factor
MQRYGSDQEVLLAAGEWLKQGHEVALATVLKTWGSSPRPPGSLMVMRRDGAHTGSVSGGCVEADIVQRYRDRQLADQSAVLVDYGVNREEAVRFGLPCGGRLELLIENRPNLAQLEQCLAAMARHELIARHVDLETGKIVLQSAQSVDAGQEFDVTASGVSKVFGSQWLILLIGAGHLSHYVSQIALMMGYRVLVCDPREDYARNWNVHGAELTTMMPDDAVSQYAQQPRSIVVALTHDPKLDDMALLDALESPAFYVGAIGSRRNCELRRQRLRQMGLSPAAISRLHAPVGLDIGSHTPAEISVSILAEITRLRNSTAGTGMRKPVKQSDSMV